MRIIAYVVPALVACGFFLFVLIEFHRDEKRPRKGPALSPAARAIAGSRVVRFPKLTEARVAHAAAQGERVPYVEMTVPAALIVTPTTKTDKDEHAGHPPRRIA